MEADTAVRQPAGTYLPSSGSSDTDPFSLIEQIGSWPPFWFEDAADAGGGYWVVTRFQDAREVQQDAATFSAIDAAVPWVVLDQPLLPSFADPPLVQRYRKILIPRMSPAVIEPLKPHMERTCEAILDQFAAAGHCDAVAEFAQVFPLAIFLELFGMPEDGRSEFIFWTHKWHHDRKEQPTAWARIREIVAQHLQAKLSYPGGDLLTAIATATTGDDPISMDDAINLASTVFLGGLDTVPSLITWSLRHLALHPELRAALVADPSLAESAVEEFLRIYSITDPRRRVTKDTDFHGAAMRAGDRVVVSTACADRDPDAFADAGRARLDRVVNPHMAFGLAAHRCLGIHLARPELAIALTTWHGRIPDYAIAPGTRLSFKAGVLSMESLPLVWAVPKLPLIGADGT
jgi:cytochrome P450